MKKLLLAAAIFLIPMLAWGQCNGVFPNNTLCGNTSGVPAPPSPTPYTSFFSSIVVGTTPITGGTSQGLLYNNAGILGNTNTANSGVLVTDGSGSPSIATTLPNGIALGTPISGIATNLTGTAAGLTSGHVTTNANLTGVITSVGNATSIASQTGTGSKFVVDTNPTIAGLTVTGSLTATGLVTNGDLVNPSTTVNGTTCTLGSTCTVPLTASGFANPTASIGLSAVNGVATTAMRSDAAPALDQSIAPTMTGPWSFTNSLSTASNVLQATAPQLLANGSNLIAGFQKTATRTWNWSYDTQNFGSGSSVAALKLCSDLACAVPIWVTDYGFLNIGNITNYPMLSPNLSDSTGPALRVVGDIAGGDTGLYFGSSEYAITAISNSGGLVEITYVATTNPSLTTNATINIAGSQTALNTGPSPAPTNWAVTVIDGTHFTLQSSTFTATCSSNCGYFGTGGDPQTSLLTLQGGFPSPRLFSPSQRNDVFNHDYYGGAMIAQCPDVNVVALVGAISSSIWCNQGGLMLGAFGSGASTGNNITFLTRSAANTVSMRWQIAGPAGPGSQGDLVPNGDAAYSIGAASNGIKQFIGTAGSAGTPLFTFQNDLTTGLYRSGGNQIGITAGGVQRAFIDGNGLVLNVQLKMPSIITSSAATTGTLCWTTGTGLVTADTTVGCLTSLAKAKNIDAALRPRDALNIVERLRPISFHYKPGWGDGGRYAQFGFTADQAATIDERLVGRDPKGALQGFRYQEYGAVLTAAMQKLKADNDNLEARIERLERRFAR